MGWCGWGVGVVVVNSLGAGAKSASPFPSVAQTISAKGRELSRKYNTIMTPDEHERDGRAHLSIRESTPKAISINFPHKTSGLNQSKCEIKKIKPATNFRWKRGKIKFSPELVKNFWPPLALGLFIKFTAIRLTFSCACLVFSRHRHSTVLHAPQQQRQQQQQQLQMVSLCVCVPASVYCAEFN